MTNTKMTLEERMGEEVEYDSLTGTFKKKLKPLTEVDVPGQRILDLTRSTQKRGIIG